MTKQYLRRKCAALSCMMIMAASAVPAYADTENLISDINVPEAGVIQYDVTVPPGSTVNYTVELKPDEKTGPLDRISGMWKNTTNKTVKKTINAKVKFLSSEYTISATYTSNATQQKLEYQDKKEAVKSYEESFVHNHLELENRNFEKWFERMEKQLKKVSDFIR